MTDEELELFPTSESALKMLSYVTPGFYDKSYVGKWMFQVMGLEYDKALKLAEELPEQFFPETATWGLCWFPDVDKALYGKHAKNVMKTDVKETDNSYEVDIDLPGFKKDEIEAKLENGYLTISAAKGLDKEEKEEKDGKYIRKERYSGAMSRSFYVGDELKQEDIKAKYEDGILKLSVPKKEQKKVETTKHIAIEG